MVFFRNNTIKDLKISHVGIKVGESCTVEVELLPSEEKDFLYIGLMKNIAIWFTPIEYLTL